MYFYNEILKHGVASCTVTSWCFLPIGTVSLTDNPIGKSHNQLQQVPRGKLMRFAD
jgi:hypothetical protein